MTTPRITPDRLLDDLDVLCATPPGDEQGGIVAELLALHGITREQLPTGRITDLPATTKRRFTRPALRLLRQVQQFTDWGYARADIAGHARRFHSLHW
ncbi:hypothetical protein ACIBKY_51425 [Nonomuraea sp. NPDC050394]|uniref:hypothetical protein n=1 Tax=Nonomuraea sp. NPDC050394 TaxID=3364363 RepID=UPI0037B8BFBD